MLTLVDHNENKEYEEQAQLVEIIDHHKNLVDRSGLKVEINSRVGSCCSLIARRYLSYCEDNDIRVNEQIALLFYGPIVLGEFVYTCVCV